MAEERKPSKEPAGGVATAEPKEVPSFSKIAEESRDARSSELASLAGIEPGKKTEKAPDEKPEDFVTRWNALPEDFRSEADRRYQASYNKALQDNYGDLMPLVTEVTKNPNLRATLAAAASDPELMEFLGDPKSREQIKDLTKKELREFLFGEAKTTYEKYARPTEQREQIDPRDQRISELEQRFTDRDNETQSKTYITNRQRELRAFTSAYPDMATPEARRQLEHVLNTAETRFEADAARAGIKTLNKDGTVREAFVAEALRAGIKPPSYREVHEEYQEILGRSTPPVAPGTSPAVIPAPAQAPRDAAEGKQRALTLLKKSGGLKGLTASTRRR